MSAAAAAQCCSARAAAWCCRAGFSRRRACVAAAGGSRKRGPRLSTSADAPGQAGGGGGSGAAAGAFDQQPPAAGVQAPAAAEASTAAAAAAHEAAALAARSPLSDRRVLAQKLTETAKHIAWGDLPHERPAEASRAQVEELQARLGYRFNNLYLLRLALVHSSAAPTTHNSILAWIGDAAMYLVVAEETAAALGYVPIGKLSEVRKTLIGRAMCERYANHLGLGRYLVLGKSVRVQSAGVASSNMVAELFEAVMGAVYLDGDLDAVRRCYISHFPLPADPLSLLQPDGSGSSAAAASGEPNPWE